MIQFQLAHCNLNVFNLANSLRFYEENFGLKECRRIEKEDFTIVYLKNDASDFILELTELKGHSAPYDLGDNETHIAFLTDDYDAAHKKHAERGIICYENPAMGIYFVEDPDGYWIEVVPQRRGDKISR